MSHGWKETMSCLIPLFVNGQPRAVFPGLTAAGLLSELTLARPGILVAVNGVAVPEGERSGRLLQAGDQVEIIQAVAGG